MKNTLKSPTPAVERLLSRAIDESGIPSREDLTNVMRYVIYWREAVRVKFDYRSGRYLIENWAGIIDKCDGVPGGVYQVYGQHPVYGEDVLLYIGRSENFKNRFEQHLRDTFFSRVNLSVGFRTVYPFRRQIACLDEQLSAIETLLILAHQPAFNSVNKVPPRSLINPVVHIFNRDWRRQLLPEVSAEMYLDYAARTF